MLFRVTFSNDTEEYYKKIPKDMQMSMTVEALSFNSAQIVARAKMISLVFWPNLFEVVSINRIDEPIEEEKIEKIEATESEVAEDWRAHDISEFFESVPDEPVKKAPEIWCLDTGIQILDPDGWDRKNYKESWYTPITRTEFIKRAMMSTCYRWPEPLLDDQEDEAPTCDCHW